MKKTVSKEVTLMTHVAGWVVPLGLMAGGWIWTCWATLVDLIAEWRRNQDYSVGQLVPLVAVYLVWSRRTELSRCRLKPEWWGIGLILAGQLLRFYGLFFLYQSAERYSLVITLAGLVLLLGGREIFYKVRWILVFLLLMVPLPGVVHNRISFPLQSLATAGAVFCLELLGIFVVQEGNVIWLNHRIPVAVAEACSGLRMLTAFVVVAATLAFMARRPQWQKIVLVFSSVPVAIGCNLFRLCFCSVLFLHVSNDVAEKVFHDFSGLIMMPMAITILLLELALMDQLVVPGAKENPLFGRGQGDKKRFDPKQKHRRNANKK
jgi:exosortase